MEGASEVSTENRDENLDSKCGDVGRQETGEKLKNITNPVLTLTVSYVLTVN